MRYFVVDAFAEGPFTGNPAGVCLLERWPDDALLQSIAFENNLSETAFLVKAPAHYELRWFTPEIEMDLCGHATLASAFVLDKFVSPLDGPMRFSTKSGMLLVEKLGDLYEMDFPARPMENVPVTDAMRAAVGEPVLEAHLARDLVLLLEDEAAVLRAAPDQRRVRDLGVFAVCVTAKGTRGDFVSRFFAPEAGVFEDPVTGSAHSELIPFWAARLGKKELVAWQASRRGGTLYCRDCGERVKIAGKARLYLKGELEVI